MKKFTLALLGVVALLFFISCGSKPTNEDADTPTAPDDTVVVDSDVSDSESTTSDDSSNSEEDAETAEDLYKQVLEAKKKIDDENLASFDQKNYLAGFNALSELDSLRADNNSKESDKIAKGKEALGHFRAVINAAYKKFAKENREAAYKAKRNADSVKAGVAEKQTYQQAVKDFQDGDSLLSMQAPEKANTKYISARDVFTELYETVSEKRAAAAAAIEAAKAKVAESAKLASQADNTAPITDENVDGIEEEDEQLLEDDDFEDPEDAVAEIPEDINLVFDDEEAE